LAEKDLPETNTGAYYTHLKNVDLKSFITLDTVLSALATSNIWGNIPHYYMASRCISISSDVYDD
jgi:hypothetical protein